MRTYNHLFGALALFTAIEILLFMSGLADSIAASLLSTGRGSLLVMGGLLPGPMFEATRRRSSWSVIATTMVR